VALAGNRTTLSQGGHSSVSSFFCPSLPITLALLACHRSALPSPTVVVGDQSLSDAVSMIDVTVPFVLPREPEISSPLRHKSHATGEQTEAQSPGMLSSDGGADGAASAVRSSNVAGAALTASTASQSEEGPEFSSTELTSVALEAAKSAVVTPLDEGSVIVQVCDRFTAEYTPEYPPSCGTDCHSVRFLVQRGCQSALADIQDPMYQYACSVSARPRSRFACMNQTPYYGPWEAGRGGREVQDDKITSFTRITSVPIWAPQFSQWYLSFPQGASPPLRAPHSPQRHLASLQGPSLLRGHLAVQLRVIPASLVDGGALSFCPCPTHCCRGTWLRLAPDDPWEFVPRPSGMSGLAAPAPRRMDARARTVGQHFMGLGGRMGHCAMATFVSQNRALGHEIIGVDHRRGLE